jgi:hypothetical protein
VFATCAHGFLCARAPKDPRLCADPVLSFFHHRMVARPLSTKAAIYPASDARAWGLMKPEDGWVPKVALHLGMLLQVRRGLLGKVTNPPAAAPGHANDACACTGHLVGRKRLKYSVRPRVSLFM